VSAQAKIPDALQVRPAVTDARYPSQVELIASQCAGKPGSAWPDSEGDGVLTAGSISS
jgi:hypothetical protein